MAAGGEPRLGGGLHVQDTAVPLVLLICSEILYSGLQGQDKTRKSRAFSATFALQAGSVARAHRLGSRSSGSAVRHGVVGWHSADAKHLQGSRAGGVDGGEQPAHEHEHSWGGLHSSATVGGLALAEWLGLLALAGCVVLEWLLWRHDRTPHGGDGLWMGWAHGGQGDVAGAPAHAAPVAAPTRVLMRAIVSGGIAI
jgi:hypothetical protein|eukprot:Tamp_19643.p1 GENE.Tamp_19643~~Tamp_19643.p1  ORF type:complete len:197 (+),score=33.92 Tamp_19643:221-811(+)